MGEMVIVHGKPHGLTSAPLQAVFDGCTELGIKAKWLNPVAMTSADVRPCLFAMTVGHKKASYDVFREYRAKGLPVLVCEYGYLRRGMNYMDEEGYYQLSWNGLNKLVNGPCPSDRFEQLGLSMVKEKPVDSSPVMVAGQVPNDAQHGMDMEQLTRYYERVIETLREYTQREILYRPHPVMTVPVRNADRRVDPRSRVKAYQPESAWAVVTYNSNLGHEALLNGVPVFCDKSAMYAEIANTNLADIEHPQTPPRSQYFNRLAYSQWTLGEMRSGKAIEYMLEALNGIRD